MSLIRYLPVGISQGARPPASTSKFALVLQQYSKTGLFLSQQRRQQSYLIFMQINPQESTEPTVKNIEVAQPPQTQQEKAKAQNRKFVIARLIRSKREQIADDLLYTAIQNNQELIAAFRSHKFGAFCLQASDLQRAQQHMNKAIGPIQNRFEVFTNAYMNLGNTWAQRKNYQKAAEYFQKVIKDSPHGNPQIYIHKDQVVYSKQLNSFSAFVDAHSNLAVMYIQMDQIERGFQICSKALELNPANSESQINFTDILRQLGKKDEAISHSWKQIQKYTRGKGRTDYKAPQMLVVQPWNPKSINQEQVKQISILTVKWGSRYGADYVNKIYSGVKRNTTWKFTFYCFTDDGTGLNPDIKVVTLEEGWKRWWGKVSLFNAGIKGRKFYIDLDMIITGPLDGLFSYGGDFCTLRTGDLACQKNHKDGYNSSVIIWNGDWPLPVYTALKDNFQAVSKNIVRFDFWLEMTIKNADYAQVLYPGIVVDFLADAQKDLPKGCSVVCFARKPKPEDYPAEWVKQYWVQ